jgi:hypothetical protein
LAVTSMHRPLQSVLWNKPDVFNCWRFQLMIILKNYIYSPKPRSFLRKWYGIQTSHRLILPFYVIWLMLTSISSILTGRPIVVTRYENSAPLLSAVGTHHRNNSSNGVEYCTGSTWDSSTP